VSIGLLLAQEAAAQGDAAQGAAEQAPTNPVITWLPIIAIGVLAYFMLIRPQQRERRTRQSMLESVKKNDRIVTIGGIYGVVMSVRREDDEVVIKVDEASSAKLRVTFSAISRVLVDEPRSDKK
jgi:preprotein translocase subunit YajC